MSNEQIQQLIDALLKTGEFVATEGYRIALKQVFTYAVLDLVSGGAMIVLGILSFYMEKKIKDSDGFCAVLGFFATVIGIFTALCSVRFFLNPEWYAIHMLIELVK